MATVWIVQNKIRFNYEIGKHDRFFDYSGAKEFGDLRYIFSHDDSSLAQQPAILKLKRELIDFKKEDSLILVGNAPLSGAAMVVVSLYNRGEVPILCYEKYTKLYYRKIYKF